MKRVVFLGFITPLVIILTFFSALAQENPPAGQDKAYLIGPGDEVEVKVMGDSQFDFKATIDEEGKLQVPFFENRLDARCRSEKDVRNDVAKMVSKYLKNPVVSLRVTDRKSRPPTNVVGEVLQPQGVILIRQTRLRELISFVGGAKEEAGGSVRIFRSQNPICPGMLDDIAGNDVNVPYRSYSLSALNNGKEEANPVVLPGDVVMVQKAPPVYVTGEVRVPQGIYLSEGGTTLTQAIAKVGGMTREAKTASVKIYRQKPDKSGPEVLNADIKLIKEGKQKDPMLEPYDIVEVDKAKDSIAMTILKIAAGVGKTTVTSLGNSAGYRVLY